MYLKLFSFVWQSVSLVVFVFLPFPAFAQQVYCQNPATQQCVATFNTEADCNNNCSGATPGGICVDEASCFTLPPEEPDPTSSIVPCGDESRGQAPCDLCHLYTGAKNIIDFVLFDLVLPLAIVAFLIGGIFMLASSGNPQMLQTGKTAITNALIGIFIAFGSWLIIATVVNTLGYQNQFTPAWNEAPICKAPLVAQPPPPPPPTVKKFCDIPSPSLGVPARCVPFDSEEACLGVCGGMGGGGTCKTSCPGAAEPPPPAGSLMHEQAKQKLADAGITISSTGNCSDKSDSRCTSLDGVRQSTIDGVISFKQECNCAVNVSGGTETEHSTIGACTHGNGCKLDISPNTKLSNYVQHSYQFIGKCFPAASACYKSPTGQIWARESNHWDVAFK